MKKFKNIFDNPVARLKLILINNKKINQMFTINKLIFGKVVSVIIVTILSVFSYFFELNNFVTCYLFYLFYSLAKNYRH